VDGRTSDLCYARGIVDHGSFIGEKGFRSGLLDVVWWMVMVGELHFSCVDVELIQLHVLSLR
jgi:hypothetical protein